MNDDANTRITHLNSEILRAWPLPMPSAAGDKEERGRILVIGGSREIPGAVILAANAALRAGAGKLAIATVASVAQLVALAIPESRVIGLPETAEGGIAPSAAAALEAFGNKLDAVLIGPGMQDEAATCDFVRALMPRLGDVSIVLDAYAMSVVSDRQASGSPPDDKHRQHGSSLNQPVLLTPHAGEMAHLSGLDKNAVLAQPRAIACSAARRWNAVVALKGATTFIATPNGRVWQHDGGNIGLAISGSGDTLSGIIAGLAARGAPLEQASAWGVALHARAGEHLATRFGPLGYLAREIAAEVPGLMHALTER
jgi:ADP-dependent NAD(P)H-hydrate dehydratase